MVYFVDIKQYALVIEFNINISISLLRNLVDIVVRNSDNLFSIKKLQFVIILYINTNISLFHIPISNKCISSIVVNNFDNCFEMCS